MSEDEDKLVAELLSFIREKLVDANDGIEVGETSPLAEMGLLNSLKMAALVNFIQALTGTRVPPQRLTTRNFRDVRHIAVLVADLTTASKP